MLPDIDTITEDFSFLDDWEDKYRYVIELGRTLPDMADSDKVPENKVHGCVSQVWLVHTTEGDGDPVIRFQANSDAHIVSGLVAIMLAAMSGKRASEIEVFDATGLMSTLGLEENLTPQRSNGLRALIARMKDAAHSATKAA